MTIMLDGALLDRFDASLRALGAPIVDAWAPGVSDGEIDALMLPLGVDLPTEARVWWGWHNGTRDDAPPISRSLGFRDVTRLQDAAEIYAIDIEYQQPVFNVNGLLTPLSGKPNLFFACRDAVDGRVAIYTQNDIETPRRVLPSIRELVLAWIALIENGAWSIKPDGIWQLHAANIPPGLAELQII
jgi:hypothetical protein